MKRIIAIFLSFVLVIACNLNIYAIEDTNDSSYLSQLSSMIQKYDSDDYFATMSVTIGEPNLFIDGIEIPIDESGSVAYVENGRTMMPVRGHTPGHIFICVQAAPLGFEH